MAKKRDTVLEELQRVRLIGPALSESLYDEHKLRSVEDLIAFGKEGNLPDLKGVGKKKAKTILSSAERIASANGRAEEAAKPAPKAKKKKSTPSAKKPAKKTTKKTTKKPTKKSAEKSAKTPETADERANGRAPEEAPRAAASSPAPRSASAVSAQSAVESAPAEARVSTNGAAAARTATVTDGPQLRQRFIDALRCPACGHDQFDVESTTLTCQACQRQFNLQNGIADLAPPAIPSRSVTQKLMESRFYAQFYEEFMRPRLTGVVSDRSMREEYRLAADFLDFGDNTRLLDVGCGTANFTRYFAQRIGLAETASTSGDLPLVVGMDLSWPMLENARRNIRQENLDGKVFLLRGDATRIPVRRGAFNRLHCAGTLHLMSDIDEGLRNFARVLEPDGVCVIGTFILGKGIMRRMLKRMAEFPTRFHWFSRDELHKRIERAGFEILDDSVAGDAITVKARRI